MDDKDRELIKSILQAGGSAASQGFHALVQWHRIDGVTTVFTCLALLVFCSWLMLRLISWQPEDNDGDIPRGFGICIVAIAIFVVICFLQSGIRDALAPEGAAVNTVLARGK